MTDLVVGDDGLTRCAWGSGGVGGDLYRGYHDDEWGRPVVDDARLFEKLVLEGFQAGLAWITILRKREAFRAAFAGFQPGVVAGFGPSDVDRLLADSGIVRHRGKIEAAIGNARTALAIIAAEGSLASLVWRHATDGPAPRILAEVPAVTSESQALSADLKRRGWRFAGPTTVYAFMQAMGLVNDHLQGCAFREACAGERVPVLAALER